MDQATMTFSLPLSLGITDSDLMDFVEIWANQRDSICQRLNGVVLISIDSGGLHLMSTWHVWEKEELSDLRGGYFEHTKTTQRRVYVAFPANLCPVLDQARLEIALRGMLQLSRTRRPDL